LETSSGRNSISVVILVSISLKKLNNIKIPMLKVFSIGILNFIKETKLPQSGQTLLNRSDFRHASACFVFFCQYFSGAPATNFSFANLDSTDFKNPLV
jgi:hypothetical protein